MEGADFEPEHPNRRAVIDIGTNSVKLLVGDVAGDVLTPVSETSRQTRLGAGFYATRRLQARPSPRRRKPWRIFARPPTTGRDVAPRHRHQRRARRPATPANWSGAIRQSCGLKMEVISGDKEAEWVFRGVTSNPKLARSPVLILDVGGGSTEFIVGDNAVPQFRSSYSLGTVRLLEQLRPGDPPGLRALMAMPRLVEGFSESRVVPLLGRRWRPAAPGAVGRHRRHRHHPGAHPGSNMAGFDRDKIESALRSRWTPFDAIWNPNGK